MKIQQQIGLIVRILNRKGSIQTNDALFQLNPPIKRLGARIWDIRRAFEQNKIKASIETVIMPDNTAKYILRKQNNSKIPDNLTFTLKNKKSKNKVFNAVQVIISEMKSNPKYRASWRNAIATSFLSAEKKYKKKYNKTHLTTKDRAGVAVYGANTFLKELCK